MSSSSIYADEGQLLAASSRESVRELSRLKYQGVLDKLLGVDRFWTEKWLLLIVFVQDLAALWLFTTKFPWTFYERTEWLLWFAGDFSSVREYSLPYCADCTPLNADICEMTSRGCFPTSRLHSTSLSAALLLCGTCAFGLWVFLARAADRGHLSPSVARNVERLGHTFLFVMYMPAVVRFFYVFCTLKTRVVEQWECAPTLGSTLLGTAGGIYLVGFPTLVAYRISLQSLYKSPAKQEAYVRTRELEYMLGLNSIYRDKRLWLFSSFTRAGRLTGVWYMVQKLLLVSMVFISGTVGAPAVFGVAGIATYLVPALLLSVGLARLYRVGSSHVMHVCFLWVVSFMGVFGAINTLGGRIINDDDLTEILHRAMWVAFGTFVAAMMFVFVMTHDFSGLVRFIRLQRSGTARDTAVRIQRQPHRSKERYFHLGKALKAMVLERCRSKFEQRQKPFLAQRYGRASNTAAVDMVVYSFDMDMFRRDLQLFLETPTLLEDYEVLSTERIAPGLTQVRLQVSSTTVSAHDITSEIYGRCSVPGDFLYEALCIVDVVPPADHQCVVPTTLLRDYDLLQYDGSAWSVTPDMPIDEECDALRLYEGRRALQVAGSPLPVHLGERDAVSQLVSILQSVQTDEVALVLGGDLPTYITQAHDNEVAMMHSLLRQRAAVPENTSFETSVRSRDEISFWILPPSATVLFSWPVNHVLVDQIKRENATNRFVDVLLEATSMLTEVSLLHRTPELVRVSALMFHVRRVQRCIDACRKLRTHHHLNAAHPLAPTFDSVLEDLQHEVRIHRGRSLAVGSREEKLPIASAFLHYRMNARRKFFALTSPRVSRMFLKLLVLRMFIQLVKKASHVSRPSSAHTQSARTAGSAAGDSTEPCLQASCEQDDAPAPEGEEHEASLHPPDTPTQLNPAEGLALENEEALDRHTIEDEYADSLGGVEQQYCALLEALREHLLSQRLKGFILLGKEEAGVRAATVREEEVASVAWLELSRELMRDLQQRSGVARSEQEGRVLLVEEWALHQEMVESRITEGLKEAQVHAQLRDQRAQQQQALDDTEQRLLQWKDEYRADHGRDPTLSAVQSAGWVADLHTQYVRLLQGAPPGVVFPEAEEHVPGPEPEPTPVSAPSSAPAEPEPTHTEAPEPEDQLSKAQPGIEPTEPQQQQPQEAASDHPASSAPETRGAEVTAEQTAADVLQESASSSAVPAGAGEGGEEGAQAPKKKKGKKGRKAELVKELNEWKAAYKEANGKEPTKRALVSDPSISSVYEEYTKLSEEKVKKEPPLADTSYEDLPLGELKALVKGLLDPLNEWKTRYKAEHGHDPTKSDIRLHPDISANYQKYTEANTVLKARKKAS